ncbi:MAG: GerW family sporulation protein [Oscillospiraceae bacterium]|nr:GerW family sporulation protein [Oscillospiraceae bacterium]
MDKRPINDLMETTMQKIREMIDANTIVGEPIVTADGITLIPVSKLSFGFAGGGSDFSKKQDPTNTLFGGGIGAMVNVNPVAFIVVNEGSIKMMSVAPPATTTIDRVIEHVPDIVDKITEFIDSRNKDDKDDE